VSLGRLGTVPVVAGVHLVKNSAPSFEVVFGAVNGPIVQAFPFLVLSRRFIPLLVRLNPVLFLVSAPSIEDAVPTRVPMMTGSRTTSYFFTDENMMICYLLLMSTLKGERKMKNMSIL
jgi:hypothetical protein